MQNLNVKISEEVLTKLREHKKNNGIMISRIVEEAIRKYLKMEKK